MNVLREKRKAKGCTQKDLSRTTGLTQSMISNIENGQRRPSVESAKKLGIALGFNWNELFEEDENSRLTGGGEE